MPGNLGNDPEVKTLDGNIKVAKFPLATNESYKDKTDKRLPLTRLAPK